MAETLAIGSVTLDVDGCCKVRDLAPLVSGSDVRGSDRLVPGSAGVIANPRRETVTVVNLQLMLFGAKDFAGVAHPDVRTGLLLNAAYLQENVSRPTGVGDGTRTATLTWQGLAAVVKPVHVLGDLSLAGDGPNMMRGILRLSFPEGLFDLSSLLGP